MNRHPLLWTVFPLTASNLGSEICPEWLGVCAIKPINSSVLYGIKALNEHFVDVSEISNTLGKTLSTCNFFFWTLSTYNTHQRMQYENINSMLHTKKGFQLIVWVNLHFFVCMDVRVCFFATDGMSLCSSIQCEMNYRP